MDKKQTKYIFVIGGVLSGVGKGISAASIGNILKNRGLKVSIQKCDPYLNVDAGTLNPAEHGECFVTKDGAETDLDLGHYERFIDEETTRESSLMSGRLFLNVINDERNGKYLGKTVQVIPHLTNAIQEHILAASTGSDIHIVEIGGTIGDYEIPAFIEAVREMTSKVGRSNCMYVHVVYVPYLGASGEFKTKPAQNAVRDLRSAGIVPDILVARSENTVPREVVEKLSLFSGVEPEAIALLPNAKTIYQVPLTLEDAGIGRVITAKLGLPDTEPDLKEWREVVGKALSKYSKTIKVGVIAKYLNNQDTYMSVFEAMRAAAWHNNIGLEMQWIDAEKFDSEDSSISEILDSVDGVLVPGGFGTRGLEGKIKAAIYCLDNKKPYLGLCLGLQMAVIGAARRAGLVDANTVELDPKTSNPVIHTMTDQKGKEGTGGTMRLGNYPCNLKAGSLAEKVYGTSSITERHRHRYECNNSFREKYESWGIAATGLSPDGNLVEVIEAIDHPFMMASQYHPELKSRPNRPHPMFEGFVQSLIDLKK